MKERRRLKRQHIMFYSRVFDRKTGAFLGYLGNLTPSGVMIICDTPLEVGGIFPLRIDLPEDLYPVNVLNLVARSVWCERDIDPNFYTVGFKTEKITAAQEKIILQINEDYGLHNYSIEDF